MNTPFIRKFNELTEDRFLYLKVSQINVNVKEQSVEVILLYPSDKREDVETNHDFICSSVVKAAKIKAKPIITLRSSAFDMEYCKRLMFEFFRAYPTVAPFIKQDNITAEIGDNKIQVNMGLEPSAAEYCNERNIKFEIEAFLASHFTDKIIFNAVPIVNDNSIEQSLKYYDGNMPEYFLEFDGGRFITPENVEEFIGKIVYDKAMYIEDCNPAMAEQSVALCGTIQSIKEIERQEGKGSFIKFNLQDYTSSISCLVFPTKYNPIDKLRLLIEGKSVVVKGILKLNEYKGQQTLSLFVKNLSLCTMPQKFEKNELIRKVAANYAAIAPKEYYEERQSNLFDEKVTEEIPSYLMGKTFVVFDFETTGLDTRRCKIIEIGAVKIIDGKIRETFTSLINPHEPLEPDTIKTTNITDDMLEDQPDIEEVFPDFHKFCEDTILVGHNSASFDLQILNRVAGEFKFKFPSKSEDTLILARRFLKLRNYKLGTLAKYYGVTNENAHRALADAIATAKIFINLAKFM